MSGVRCAISRQLDGTWRCHTHNRSWDTQEEITECEPEIVFDRADLIADPVEVRRGIGLVIGVDLAAPNGDFTAMTFPPNAKPSLLEFAEMFYDIQPYQRQLLQMLDQEIRRGDKIRRKS